MADLTPRQLEILQHCLGLDKYGQPPKQCHPDGRNHYCAGAGDEPTCRELVTLGLMAQHETTTWLPYFNCSVTKAGKDAVRENSPKPPKLTRSQKRYRDYLNASDAFGCNFREYLNIIKTDWYKNLKGAS